MKRLLGAEVQWKQEEAIIIATLASQIVVVTRGVIFMGQLVGNALSRPHPRPTEQGSGESSLQLQTRWGQAVMVGSGCGGWGGEARLWREGSESGVRARLWREGPGVGAGPGCCLNPAYKPQDLPYATEFSQLSPLSCELEVIEVLPSGRCDGIDDGRQCSAQRLAQAKASQVLAAC